MDYKDEVLLFKDICARLPYGVDCLVEHNGEHLDSIITVDVTTHVVFTDVGNCWLELDFIKPYLRPLSSMTEEEKKEFAEVTGGNCSFIDTHGNFFIDFGEFICEGSPVSLSRIVYVINWLYAHYFDVNDLISKGLAVEAPKDMYNRI